MTALSPMLALSALGATIVMILGSSIFSGNSLIVTAYVDVANKR
ncbi:MAG: Uncharacterised protein [Puniceicoccaceae bacterium MED-G32]|nr:MAG: Uncharacterised protein [Puniceicoccaceae bacterium MED-G32]